MKYDFDTLVDRNDKFSRKWELRDEAFENNDKSIPPFSVADYDLKPPKKMLDLFKEYLDDMVFGYMSVPDAYYESFINWTKRRHNFTYKREWILDDNGVVSGICNSIRVFTNEGDGVIVMPPVYPPFFSSVENSGRKLVLNELINEDNHYKINFEQLEKQVKDPNNKMLVLCNPHNPVGRAFSQEELKKVSDLCYDNNVLVVSDEIHMDLILPGHKHTIFKSVDDNALNNSITLTSASKTFNLAGSRTSMVIIANEQLREKYIAYTSKFCHNRPNSFGFKLFEIAYNHCEDYLDQLMELVYDNYQTMVNYFKENLPMLKVVEMEATYLVFVDARELNLSDEDLYDFFGSKAQIVPTPGHSFGDGGSGFVRINIAVPKAVLKAALDRLKESVDSLYE